MPFAVAALFGSTADLAVAKEPAVSQSNLKVTGAGGTVDGDGAWLGAAGFTAPLGQSWGMQGEAGILGVDDDTVYGTAGHVYMRDPESYLAGLFAAYASEDKFDVDATRVGAEVEFYLDQVTLLAKAGYQFSDLLSETAFGDIELRWYLSDNFALSGGGSFDENSSLGRVSGEWLLGSSALPGLALRAEAVVGEGDYDSVMGGVTYYFGGDSSLKDRHRKQDPDSALFGLFQSIEREKAELCKLYQCDGPPPPPPPT